MKKKIIISILISLIITLLISSFITLDIYGKFHPFPFNSNKMTNNFNGCFEMDSWKLNNICPSNIVCVNKKQCLEFKNDNLLPMGLLIIMNSFMIYIILCIIQNKKNTKTK